jgi:(1->4)-alpha-D-glucan 1-alpha-D-glucosylmutase
MQTPRATYRLQFNENFRLPHALALVPYLHSLGVSHIYASPLFKATPHSSHGYDVCDFNQLNAEIGTETELEELVKALHEKQMGLVLDIVPNHMGVTAPENGWWWDVLKIGRASPFANHFDIDWNSSNQRLNGKILLPVLGGEYHDILQKGDLKIEAQQGDFILRYFENRFPLKPDSIKTNFSIEQLNSNLAALDQIIQRQHYLLEFHARGDEQLNYRRFFSISSLAGVRVEEQEVFNNAHSLVRQWLDKGWLDGLRVDHPDGLRDPGKYLKWLRDLAPQAWIVVEKIVEPEEQLPKSWAVAGTTGYDFLNQLNGLFVDSASEKVFTDFYAEFTGETVEYPRLVRAKKRNVLNTLLAAELNRLTGLLVVIAARRKLAKTFSRTNLQEALAEIIVYLPVYRSYISEDGPASAEDGAVLKLTVHNAGEHRTDLSPLIFSFIEELLLEPTQTKNIKDFVARFQQLTGPVMAKGVEDTVFYCYNRFISLNEVGGEPKSFGVTLEKFHQFLRRQQIDWPNSQLTSSTHDTKRAEDVRARLNLISEIPEQWMESVRRWSAMNACHRQNEFPDRNAEYFFYQTLAGAWPLSIDRAQAYMEKAVHESKQHTTWTHRNEAYEKALQNFISETLHDPQFTTDLERFTGVLADAAAVNSLGQTLIRLTGPGVPDIYQGCEIWDLSLVDPDNRRPVDFELRQRLLASAKSLSAEAVWKQRAGGLPKLWLIQKTLQLRAQLTDFFSFNYKPLMAVGGRAEHVVAFARGEKVITIVTRFLLKLKNDWQDTKLELPSGNWRNEFTGENFAGEITMAKLFVQFPVALLVNGE